MAAAAAGVPFFRRSTGAHITSAPSGPPRAAPRLASPPCRGLCPYGPASAPRGPAPPPTRLIRTVGSRRAWLPPPARPRLASAPPPRVAQAWESGSEAAVLDRRRRDAGRGRQTETRRRHQARPGQRPAAPRARRAAAAPLPGWPSPC